MGRHLGWRNSVAKAFSGLALALFVLVGAACDQRPRQLLTAECPTEVVEGQQAEITLTIRNTSREPIIPLALCLYARPDPTEYLVQRKTIGEVEYYKPLQATEVRHLQTLDRIEADHVRDGEQWRHVPHSRFLHPRILLPGQAISEKFQLQAMESYRKLLYCDFYYLPWGSDRVRGRLFVRTKPDTSPADAQRYTEVFSRVDDTKFEDPNPQPDKYLLYRPARIYDRPPELLTQEVSLKVRPLTFPYRQAARRARTGARTSSYFAPAGAWVFEYEDGGTWVITPDTVVKLKGRYADLLADLARRQATVLTLMAPRKPDDKFLQHLEKAGYADPAAAGPNAVATIPTEHLIAVIQQAEALGYLIEPTTWRPAQPEAPPAKDSPATPPPAK